MGKKRIKTGIFGGSFNPIHIGHLALANYLCEFCGLEEIWFMISPQNPLKKQKELLEDEKRLELVQTAVAGYDKFHASDFEFRLPRPSFTVNTLEVLRNTYPEREFVLIIGADNWNVFYRWKDPIYILSHFKVLVYPRPGFEVRKDSLPDGVELVQTPHMEISSSFIRKSIRQGKDVRYFLHASTYEQIKEWYGKQKRDTAKKQ